MVIISDDIVFAEIGTGLDLDEEDGEFPAVLKPVALPQRDIDGLVFGHDPDLFPNGDMRCSCHHNPMFGPVMMALKRERCAGLHINALDLKTVA